MYNTKFLFTYKLHDDEEDQDTLYRHEYLYAFGIKEYDSDIIMKTLEYIYEKLKDIINNTDDKLDDMFNIIINYIKTNDDNIYSNI